MDRVLDLSATAHFSLFLLQNLDNSKTQLCTMADHELADYEDEPEYPSVAGTGAGAVAGAEEGDKKNYAGIHSSGFRLVYYSPSP